MTRLLYRCLLGLHPAAFRRQFAGEMLWIFDETAATEGAARLLLDGAISLLRQWMIGGGAWKVAAGILGGAVQMAIVGMLIPTSAPYFGPPPLARSGQFLSYRDLEFPNALLFVLVALVPLAACLRSAVATRGK